MKALNSNKGVALLIVIGVIFAVTLLANVAIRFTENQDIHTSDQTTRIQAFYASQAGMNLALEKLRLGDWPEDPQGLPDDGDTEPHNICGPNPGWMVPCEYQDNDFPPLVKKVFITLTRDLDSTDPDTRIEINTRAEYN